MSDVDSRPVRTRFAPSPTGPLHIGGVRSALFTWLLARHHGGQFILRIEDTDQTRFVPGSVEMITDVLSWLGLNWDEGPDKGGAYGPYVQSERKDLYHKWIQVLLDNGSAYKCYTTSEELAQINEENKAKGLSPGYDRRHRDLTPEQQAAFEAEGRSHVIRIKMPLEGTTIGYDLIRGEVEFDNSTLQDVVLIKSDGFPTYHFAHVVDDYLMQISHVTRANEWLPSLPIHINIWKAFGWDIPYYAHLPVLLNPNGQGKLSKRHESFEQNGQKVLVLGTEYRDSGYLPEAVVNFLSNIGWNFGDEREVFDVMEAIERFDITQVNAANSAFPMDKLDWLNGIYIREKLSVEELAKRLRKPLEDAGLEVNEDTLLKVTPLVQIRIKSLNDVVEMAGFFFHAEFIPPAAEDLIQKKMDTDGTISLLEAAHAKLSALNADDWTTDTLQEKCLELVQELGLKNGQVFGALRVAVTGQRVSTPTFESMEVFGKDESLRRIKIGIDLLSQPETA